MIPRKIRKPTLSVGRILPLLATGLLVVLTWTADLPIWVRGSLGLLIASVGLFVTFGGWGGQPVSKMLSAAMHYLLRPHHWAWARGRRTTLAGVLRRPPIWWWKLVERIAAIPKPSPQVLVTATVAALVIVAITSAAGWSFWANADARAASVPPTLNPYDAALAAAPAAIEVLAPAATTIPSATVPASASTPSPAPPPTPAVSVFDVAWQGEPRPGHLRLSPAAGPVTVTLVLVGADVTTHTLLLDRDTVVPLVPAFHPTLTQVRVLSESPVQVEQVYYAPYQCASANAWWLWVDPDPSFAPAHLVLYPGTEALVESSAGTLPLTARRGNRLPCRRGLYRVSAAQPFCLEVWFEN